MPNSAWAETASSLTLAPTTTTVNAGSSAENVNYLTNSDKILLMQEYNAELATQTQLDSTAKSLGVPSTNYDNAVANIGTTLVTAGAPSNWSSIWPDGTTSGPWPGIQTSLAGDWSGIATARAALQTSISNTQASQQAATAESNAIAAAASSAASLYATTIQSPAVVTALPTLPNSDYPNQKIVWNTGDGQLYQNNNGTWKALSVDAPNISGTLTAAQIASVAAAQVTGQLSASQIASVAAAQLTGQISNSQIAAGAIGATQIAAGQVVTSKLTITDTTNICGNPSGITGPDNWSASISSSSNGGNPGDGTFLILDGLYAYYGDVFPVNPGETYYFSAECAPWSSPQGPFTIGFEFGSDPNLATSPAWFGAVSAPTTQSGWQTISGQLTIPAGYTFVRIWVEIGVSSGTTGSWAFQSLIVRKAASGELLVDGSITASKIAAGAITADMITTGTLNAAQVNVTNLDASNITAGTLSATMVLFPDGSELSTASRVTNTMYSASGGVAVDLASTPVAIPGLSFTVTTSATANDVYNINGVLTVENNTASNNPLPLVELDVDGTLNQKITLSLGLLLSSFQGQFFTIPFFMTVSGLTAGSHTFTFYLGTTADGTNSGGTQQPAFTSSTPSYVQCQRFY